MLTNYLPYPHNISDERRLCHTVIRPTQECVQSFIKKIYINRRFLVRTGSVNCDTVTTF